MIKSVKYGKKDDLLWLIVVDAVCFNESRRDGADMAEYVVHRVQFSEVVSDEEVCTMVMMW